jgi:hypothetical protein
LSEIRRRSGFYGGYLPGDNSPIPSVVVLAMTLALWLLVYLGGLVGG